jgi:hypothetical protein
VPGAEDDTAEEDFDFLGYENQQDVRASDKPILTIRLCNFALLPIVPHETNVNARNRLCFVSKHVVVPLSESSPSKFDNC